MEYKINKVECARKNELPNLIHRGILSHAGRDPILKNILEPDFEQLKHKYPLGHKKTLVEINSEINLLNFKRDLITRTREELIKLYEEDPDLHSIVMLDICKSCNNSLQCSQYQNYFSGVLV
jgi:hypothetical protein